MNLLDHEAVEREARRQVEDDLFAARVDKRVAELMRQYENPSWWERVLRFFHRLFN